MSCWVNLVHSASNYVTSNLNSKMLLNNEWTNWQNLKYCHSGSQCTAKPCTDYRRAADITVFLTCNSFSVSFCSAIFLFNVSTLAVRVVTDALSVTVSLTALSFSFTRTALTIETRFKTSLSYWTQNYLQLLSTKHISEDLSLS